MKLTTNYMIRNDCYRAGRKITPKGIMVHSTATPGVMAAAWFSRWNKSYQAGEINRQVCVHAFLDHQEVCQYLPWDHRGWHAGGAANNTHISFEICEPAGFSYSGGANMVGYDVKKNEAYFRAAWKNAVVLCVMLCQRYGLTEKEIIDHSEGHKRGIASNHADVMHWFPKHGESMDSFRAAVKRALQTTNPPADNPADQVPSIKVDDVVEIKTSADVYYPGGPSIPTWVKKDSYHKVTQLSSRGKPVIRGGKTCVLLGRKVHKTTGKESAGIMTWVDQDVLSTIASKSKVIDDPVEAKQYYRVQVGAFTNIDNAHHLQQKLKAAGFDSMIVRS